MANAELPTIRPTLQRWIADAAASQDIADFKLASRLGELDYLEDRRLDLYHSLVGQLFDMMRTGSDDRDAWATTGNALLSLSRSFEGSLQADAKFFAATAFHAGGYSAAAYLSLKDVDPQRWHNDAYRACQDLLTRPPQIASPEVRRLVGAVRDGNLELVHSAVEEAHKATSLALTEGPDPWIAARVFAVLMDQFERSNIRSVLPDGQLAAWTPLVRTMLDRQPPMWEFFPSQAEAIRAGLLSSEETYSLQMPTGAGKTAITETLLYSHLTATTGNLAVLLVPFRALARELRTTVGRRLSNELHLPTRVVYGGTVPTAEEASNLEGTRAIIATPEALLGLLGAHPEVFRRISLVICDEGHLLDAPGRGISLELLLARFHGRQPRPRMVFLSAIVPNIEEINTWLGGSQQGVVRSRFRPSIAEFAVLRPSMVAGKKSVSSVTLQLQTWDGAAVSHEITGFLTRQDFQFTNPRTGRTNTYDFSTVKAQAIAAARKALSLGSVAVFAAMKTGNQGVLGLAEELLSQVEEGIPLPDPSSYTDQQDRLHGVVDYLSREYGDDWGGTRALEAGVVVHHGDVPQETREVLEELYADRVVPMVICTSTLAEGVNMPIRTLVLYSVEFSDKDGRREPMLARDVQNLVGRAGRAGSSTRGLVICANPNQWSLVRPVATGTPGEVVEGALYRLIKELQESIVDEGLLPDDSVLVDNDLLEGRPLLFSLVDGIDATLVELLSDDMGLGEFQRRAERLASDTFASVRMSRDEQRTLRRLFSLRATRLSELHTAGQLAWVRRTGAMPRMVSPVLNDLLPSLPDLDDVDSVLDAGMLDAVLTWALTRREFIRDSMEAYRSDVAPHLVQLRTLVRPWLRGDTYRDIAGSAGLTVDECLRIHSKVVAYSLVTLVEQSFALLQCQVEESGGQVPDPVALLPDCLRYGVSSRTARDLVAGGIRHRQAAILLANEVDQVVAAEPLEGSLGHPSEIAASIMDADSAGWIDRLGPLQFRRTRRDLGLLS